MGTNRTNRTATITLTVSVPAHVADADFNWAVEHVADVAGRSFNAMQRNGNPYRVRVEATVTERTGPDAIAAAVAAFEAAGGRVVQPAFNEFVARPVAERRYNVMEDVANADDGTDFGDALACDEECAALVFASNREEWYAVAAIDALMVAVGARPIDA